MGKYLQLGMEVTCRSQKATKVTLAPQNMLPWIDAVQFNLLIPIHPALLFLGKKLKIF